MRKVNVKALMIITFLTTSILAMPIMANAQDNGDGGSSGPGMDPRKMSGAFNQFGMSGQILGSIFEVLFNQTMNLDDVKFDKGLYVLHASKSQEYEGIYNFIDERDTDEIHFLPWRDDGAGNNNYTDSDLDGPVYCHVQKAGEFDYTLEVGASVTMAIWDYDESFITAAKKITEFMEEVRNAKDEGNEDEARRILMQEGIALMAWLFTNINNIFTGDELFILNPITWSKLEIRPGTGFSITKTWHDAGLNGYMQVGGGDDDTITDISHSNRITDWRNKALYYKDHGMAWLCDPTDPTDTTVWTTLSFDLIQLWVKNFEIHIDLSELSSGGTINPARVFNGLDVEFYIFTHHLEGAYLYNDLDSNNKVTVRYDEVKNGTETAVTPDGEPIRQPNTTELTHKIMLSSMAETQINKPKENSDGNVEWGITLLNPEIIPMPMGLGLHSYIGATSHQLPFITFNLEFIKEDPVDIGDGKLYAEGEVKLTHNFGPWSTVPPEIDGLDLVIVYISSIFHFHLDVDTEDLSDTDEVEGDMEADYAEANKTIKIGNYIDTDADLDFVDIAGPNYKLSNTYDSDNEPTGYTEHPASTQNVPVGLWKFQGKAHNTNTGDEGTEDDDYSTDVNLEISHNVMYYGICYPQWNGSGTGIWHDPTFSVYMVFTPENAGFWALILLIAGVGLVGLATVLIKKRKDRGF